MMLGRGGEAKGSSDRSGRWGIKEDSGGNSGNSNGSSGGNFIQ